MRISLLQLNWYHQLVRETFYIITRNTMTDETTVEEVVGTDATPTTPETPESESVVPEATPEVAAE